MKISRLRHLHNGFVFFDLNVGGFLIRNCRWNPQMRHVRLPFRRNLRGRWRRVVSAPGKLVIRLRTLLESGETTTKRDRRPCSLWITYAKDVGDNWFQFNFTVRGFTIYECRWQPLTGSIQLPVTYVGTGKRRVVCAYGAHICRLRAALEEFATRMGICQPAEFRVLARGQAKAA